MKTRTYSNILHGRDHGKLEHTPTYFTEQITEKLEHTPTYFTELITENASCRNLTSSLNNGYFYISRLV
jgi:hypothetical protein